MREELNRHGSGLISGLMRWLYLQKHIPDDDGMDGYLRVPRLLVANGYEFTRKCSVLPSVSLLSKLGRNRRKRNSLISCFDKTKKCPVALFHACCRLAVSESKPQSPMNESFCLLSVAHPTGFSRVLSMVCALNFATFTLVLTLTCRSFHHIGSFWKNTDKLPLLLMI